MSLKHRSAFSAVLLSLLLSPVASHAQDKPIGFSTFRPAPRDVVVFTDNFKKSLSASRISYEELSDLLKTVKQQQKSIEDLQKRIKELEDSK